MIKGKNIIEYNMNEADQDNKKECEKMYPYIAPYLCIKCRSCQGVCLADAIKMVENVMVVDETKCVKCGLCISVCPV